MPYFIALVGFIILSGGAGPSSLPDTASTTSAKIALADPVHVERPASPESYTVKLTSYNALPEQTDSTPFTTSIGALSNPEVVAARSSDLAEKLPYGTIVAFEGPEDGDSSNCHFSAVKRLIGYRVIADAMNPRIHNTVDVLLDETDTVTVDEKEMNPSRALGLCSGVTVKVIGKIAKKDFPKTQAELLDIIRAGQLAMR
jgi:3D (Asp-Asp-Asp) domain-containing protein